MVSGQRGGEGSDPPGLVGCREHVGFFLEPWGAAGRGFLEVREGCESRLQTLSLAHFSRTWGSHARLIAILYGDRMGEVPRGQQGAGVPPNDGLAA